MFYSCLYTAVYITDQLAERQAKERKHQASKLEHKFMGLLAELAPGVNIPLRKHTHAINRDFLSL